MKKIYVLPNRRKRSRV